MSFKLCSQDGVGLFMKKDKKNNGGLYYRYSLAYVGYVFYIEEYTVGLINILEQFFRLKAMSLGQTDRYLCENVKHFQTTDDQVIWSMNCQ